MEKSKDGEMTENERQEVKVMEENQEETCEAADGGMVEEEASSPGTALSPIKAFTQNEGVEERPNVSLREILGGDILTGGWLRRQMGLIVLCTFFAIVYITNRYSSEQEIIEIERLKTELTEAKYRALTRSSELTVKTRQSQVEENLRTTPDSVLEIPKEPPFLINAQNEEEE